MKRDVTRLPAISGNRASGNCESKDSLVASRFAWPNSPRESSPGPTPTSPPPLQVRSTRPPWPAPQADRRAVRRAPDRRRETPDRCRYDGPMIAAAYLHDTVEKTAVEIDEIRERFGPDAGLVDCLSEDPEIDGYAERKRRSGRGSSGPAATGGHLRRRPGGEHARLAQGPAGGSRSGRRRLGPPWTSASSSGARTSRSSRRTTWRRRISPRWRTSSARSAPRPDAYLARSRSGESAWRAA